MKKTELKRAWWGRAPSTALGVICLTIMSGAGVDAATLWSNGASIGSYGPGDSSNTGYTIFDNFATSSPVGWVVTGFDITDFFQSVPSTDYRSTTWSIWNGDPLNGGLLVAKGSGGSATAGCAANAYCQINVTGIAVYLAPGVTYFLGTNNVLNNGDTSYRAFSSGLTTVLGVATTPQPALPGWEESNGSITGNIGTVAWSPQGCGLINGVTNTCVSGTGTNDTVFDITGTLAPEPGTLVLMSLALAGLGYKLRRRVV